MARILIVDDDPDVVEACRLVLEGAGHTVEAACNRADGMNAVREGRPDLLVLDVIMEQPDDGIAMAQELRRTGFAAPIIMLTSLAQVTGQSFGRDDEMVPVDEFLEKPISPAALLEVVTARLAGKEAPSCS